MKKKQLNFESEGYVEFICYIIVWNIRKLKNLKSFFFGIWICNFRYLLISINGYSYFSVALFKKFN